MSDKYSVAVSVPEKVKQSDLLTGKERKRRCGGREDVGEEAPLKFTNAVGKVLGIECSISLPVQESRHHDQFSLVGTRPVQLFTEQCCVLKRRLGKHLEEICAVGERKPTSGVGLTLAEDSRGEWVLWERQAVLTLHDTCLGSSLAGNQAAGPCSTAPPLLWCLTLL